MKAYVLLALLFGCYAENRYFGLYFSPKSDAEMVCDILLIGFCCVTCAIITTGKGNTK